MCHWWLAAGLTGFLTVTLLREIVAVRRAPAPIGLPRGTGLLGAKLRQWFRHRIRPLVDLAVASGCSPDVATVLQLASSLACAIAYARAWIFTAGLLLIVSGTLDVLDGEMARSRGREGPRGAYIDSVVDRYGEALVFAGMLALYRNSAVVWMVAAAWAGSFLVSYARARAESLGVTCDEGWMQRPERFVLLGGTSMIGTLVSHLTCNANGDHRLQSLAVAIGAVALLANITALQRVRGTLRRLG